MEGQDEAAADVLTGGVIARAVEPAAGETPGHNGHEKCRNCGATLTGAYCSSCGQAAHLHRSLVSLGHDILHGVFHFEGKIWRTIPELFFHPGRLTRRYIDGERAKFVSPMALYLFTVFLMFVVFSFTSDALLLSAPEGADSSPVSEWKSNIQSQMETIDDKMEAMQKKLDESNLTAVERAQLEKNIADQQAARDVMEAMLNADPAKMAEFEARQRARNQASGQPSGANVNIGLPKLKARLNAAIEQANDNPSLLLYKLKSAGYKFSWTLIPLSVPFMWLLFFWRRNVHVYDHAIFVTYSISFMMLFVIVLSVAATAGLRPAIWGTALGIVPPLHLYKQLRGAYGLSRFGAVLRLFMLFIMIIFVLVLFGLLLLALGVLG